MGAKYNKYDFNFENHEKKKHSKWLYIGLILIIVLVIKIISSEKNNLMDPVNTKSFELEIPKINKVQINAGESKAEKVKQQAATE